jgi:flagellar hook-length control protein FliK
VEVGLLRNNSIQSARLFEAKGAKAKFSDTLAEMQSSTPKKEISKAQDQDDFSKLIYETASYLKETNLKDIEKDGGLILQEVLEEVLLGDHEGLLKKILEQSGIEGSQLNVFIQKWSNDDVTADGEELLKVLSGLLEKMAELPQKDITNKLDPNDLKILKSLKLHELLLKYSASSEEGPGVNKYLKGMGDKLLNQSASAKSTTDYIQMRFTRLAAEINLKNAETTNLIQTNDQAEHSIGAKNETNGLPLGFLQQVTKLEQLGLWMGSQEKPVSAEQLLKQFEAILSKSQFLNSGGSQKLFIKLFPEHLGSIRVELFQKDQTIVAKIFTSTGTAKDALESQLSGLKQAFAGQNIAVERIEILQQSTPQERFLNKDSGQQHRQPDRREQEDGEDKGEFSLVFEEAQLNAEA